MITLPGEADLAREIARDVDPGAIHQAREHLRRAIAAQLRDPLARVFADFATPGDYSPDAASAGRRALRNAALGYLAMLDDGPELAAQHFNEARNMTDRMASLSTLARIDCPQRQAALDAFYSAAGGNHLVVDKWLALNAMSPLPSAVDDIRALMDHPAFSLANPNKVRALIGTFASSNAVSFNRPDGEGYKLLADVVISIDGKNPQLAARLAGGFKSWRVLETVRKSRAETELARIAATDGLSRDTYEIVSKSLR